MSSITARTIAPLVAMGATVLARKGMSVIYVRRTGHEPPRADDMEISIVRAFGWAVATAVVSVAIEVTVTRIAAQMVAAQELDELTGAELPS